mmetsp:Transcript_8739/g.20445  ORF Transcript_8739/g.20445 Transcript_8739/m.20445 type:complete len:288 (-) Transcript_8739:4-867(-)
MVPRRVGAAERLHEAEKGGLCALCAQVLELGDAVHALVEHDLALADICDMRTPPLESVEDVRGEQDSHPSIALLLEPLQQSLPRKHVEVCSDLIKKKNLGGKQEGKEKLDAPLATIRQLIHPPVQVDAEAIHNVVPPLFVPAINVLKHARHPAVTFWLPPLADNRAVPPSPNVDSPHQFYCPARARLCLDVGFLSEHTDRARVPVHTSDAPEQAGLSRTVGTNDHGAACLGQHKVHLVECRLLIRGPLKAHPLDDDRHVRAWLPGPCLLPHVSQARVPTTSCTRKAP